MTAPRQRLVTADEMDRMTPDERAAVVEAGIVTNWDDLGDTFQQKVVSTARRLAAERAAS